MYTQHWNLRTAESRLRLQIQYQYQYQITVRRKEKKSLHQQRGFPSVQFTEAGAVGFLFDFDLY